LELAHETLVQQNNGSAFNLLHVYNIMKNKDNWSTITKEHTGFQFALRKMNLESNIGDSNVLEIVEITVHFAITMQKG